MKIIMKCLSIYWLCSWVCSWFRKSTKDNKFEYSESVIHRHALEHAQFDSNLGKIIALKPSSSPKAVTVFEVIYHQLSILDSKASALMRLNGVMFAAAAFLLGPDFASSGKLKEIMSSYGGELYLVISGFMSLLSIILCLIVISVDWKFLDLVESDKVEEKIHLDFSKEFFHLQKVIDFRVFFYQFAWLVSLLATFFLFFYFYVGL